MKIASRSNVESAVLIVIIGAVAWIAGATGGLAVPSAVRAGVAGALGVVAWRIVQLADSPDIDSDSEARRPGFEHAAVMENQPDTYRPEQLERLESMMDAVTSGASDLHVRMRPVLREIAIDRLRVKRGIDLDSTPDQARALLGDMLYDIVRPDRPLTQDRGSRGVSPNEVAPMIDALEAL